MGNPFAFFWGGRGRRNRRDTESGEKERAEREKIDKADKAKLRPAHAGLEPTATLEDSDEAQQQKMYAEYTKYMLAEMNDDTVPTRPLAKAKFFLQKYTMIAAALKTAEAKHAQLRVESEKLEELSDEEDEDEHEDDGKKKAKEKAASAAKLRKWSINLVKVELDELEELTLLKRKAEYARQKAEEAYNKLPFGHKLAFKVWSLVLRYFRGEPDIFGNPHISYTSLAMAVLCLFTFGYCIILQFTIMARTIEASYIDDSGNADSIGPSGNTSGNAIRLTQTSFNPTYATSFRKATRTMDMEHTTRPRPTIEARQISVRLTTAPPNVLQISVPTAYNVPKGTVALSRHRLAARKTFKNTAPAGNLEAACLYYNGSSLPKRGSLAVALSVVYHLWFIAVLVLLLFYENLRLRYNRHVHSAAVTGLAQSWIGVSFSVSKTLGLIAEVQDR